VLYSTHVLTPERPIFSLALISALGLIAGIFAAFMMPAFQSLLPDLVPRPSLMNAIALNSAQFQSSRLLGPLVTSAFVLLGASMGDVFMVNAASFLFVIASLWAIRPHPESEAATRSARPPSTESTWQRLTAGVSYARENKTVGALIVSTAFITVFAMPYMMLLPAVVHRGLGTSGQIADAQVSWLMSANGLGAVAGALFVASLPANADRERIIPFSIMAMALVLVGFSLSHTFWLSIVLSILAGVAFLTTNSLTNTSVQARVPGHLRGRVMALFVMSFIGIMPISAAVFGPVGEAVGAPMAVLGGAVVLMGWGLYLLLSKALKRGMIEEDGNGSYSR
jgi:MFS family permease